MDSYHSCGLHWIKYIMMFLKKKKKKKISIPSFNSKFMLLFGQTMFGYHVICIWDQIGLTSLTPSRSLPHFFPDEQHVIDTPSKGQ